MGMRNRQGTVSLWAAYSVAFLIVYFFSAGVFAQLPLWGCVPICMPAAAAMVAVLEGSFRGAVFGMCLGLFSCLAHGGSGAGLIFAGAMIGMLAGLWQERKLKRHTAACLVSAWLAIIGVELFQILGQLLSGSGASAATLLHIAGAESAYSILLTLPACPLFAFVNRRFRIY